MIDIEKYIGFYCDENDFKISISYEMPEGYETANGMYDPTINTLFINESSFCHMEEYEQLFYLFHELRHAFQYLNSDMLDSLINRSRFYAVMYDGVCYKLIGNDWTECKLEGSKKYFTEMYLGQPYEIDANRYAYEKVKLILGDSQELEELRDFWMPKEKILDSEYEALYNRIDNLVKQIAFSRTEL